MGSRSSGSREEEEAALTWAAIERLPTYSRMRTSILQFMVEGENNETQILHEKLVDVSKLDENMRKEFVARNFKVPAEDNEKFLKKIRDRMDMYVFIILDSCYLR